MMSESQLRLLSNLVEIPDREVALTRLADRLDWSLSHTSRVVSGLVSQGAVRVRETGTGKLVALAETEPMEQFQTLVVEHDHVPFPEYVAGSAMQLLYYLDRSRTATELAEESGVSRATAYRRLKDLQRVGIVGKSNSHFQLNGPFSSLASFARGLAHQQHRREAEQRTSGVNILWERHDEYLLACDTEIDADGFHLTGPALFAEFDLPLLTTERRHYLRSERLDSVSPADLVCHTLLIDDGPRYRSYCLLLIEATEIDRMELQASAEYYDVEADLDLVGLVDDLVEYIDTRGESGGSQLPSWTEFTNLAGDYEVEI